MSEPRLLPTSSRDLLTALVGGLLLGFAGVWVFTLTGATVPVTPWTLPGVLVVLALGAVYYARTLAVRVREARGSITPEEGVRALVLGKVMLVGGALLAGAHIGYVIDFLPRMDAPTPHQRVVRGAVTVAASAVFAAGGWVLERACRTDAGTDDDDADTGPRPA